VRRLGPRKEQVSGAREQFLTVIAQSDFAQSHEQMTVAAQPRHITPVEDDKEGVVFGDIPLAHVAAQDRGEAVLRFTTANEVETRLNRYIKAAIGLP
jgi:hypothetical protein